MQKQKNAADQITELENTPTEHLKNDSMLDTFLSQTFFSKIMLQIRFFMLHRHIWFSASLWSRYWADGSGRVQAQTTLSDPGLALLSRGFRMCRSWITVLYLSAMRLVLLIIMVVRWWRCRSLRPLPAEHVPSVWSVWLCWAGSKRLIHL